MPSSPTSILATIVSSLASARTSLGVVIEQRFSSYANENLLWENRAEHLPSTRSETDPSSVDFAKASLVILRDLEKIVSILEENQKKGELGKPYLPYNIYQILSVIGGDLLRNLEVLAKHSKEANVHSHIQNLFPLLQKIQKAEISLTDIIDLGYILPEVGKDFSFLMESYFNHQGPSEELSPEASYQHIEEQADEKISHQAKKEWALLVEPGRDLLRITQGLTELLTKVASQKEKALIEKTQQALENAEIDQNGYYTYSNEETELSHSIKAIANLGSSLNELCYASTKGFAGKYLKIIDSAYRSLAHFNNIKWIGIGADSSLMMKAAIDGLLVKMKENYLPKIETIAADLNKQELANHLRQGALSDELRSAFHQIESLYIERGLAIKNPFAQSTLDQSSFTESVSEKSKEANKLSHLLKQYLLRGELVRAKWKGFTSQTLGFGVMMSPMVSKLFPTLSMASTLSYVFPYLNKVTDPIYGVIQNVAAQVAEGTISLGEGVKRSLVGFPRIELIQRLEHFSKSEKWDLETRANLRGFQEQLIAELSQDERYKLITVLLNPDLRLFKEDSPGLISRIKDAQKREKQSQGKSLLNRLSSTLDNGPSATLIEVCKVAKAKNKTLAQALHQSLERQDALEEGQRLKHTYLIQSLEKKGLSSLLNAIQEAKDHPEINQVQKFQLASYLADIDGVSRASNLANAHQLSVEFINDPLKVAAFVAHVKTQSLKLSQSLTVELLMSGHLSFTPEYQAELDRLNGDLPKHLISRIEVEQILAVQAEAMLGEQAAAECSALINAYLTGERQTINNKVAWIEAIVSHANDLREQDRSTEALDLGLVLAKLARADGEAAKEIFALPAAQQWLKEVCLKGHKNSALYYEAFVNSKDFNYLAANFSDFLTNNEDFLSAIHEIQKKEKLADLSAHYGARPWSLAEGLERFIKTKLSVGSKAEAKLKALFTTLCLLPGAEGASIRQKMLGTQLEAQGSIHSNYLELLTTERTETFWNAVKADIGDNALEQQQVLSIQQANRVMAVAKLAFPVNNEPYFKTLNKTISRYLDKQEKSIDTICSNLDASASERSPLKCRFAQQELNKQAHQSENYFKSLTDKVLMHSAQAVNARIRKDITEFKNKVKKQLNILSEEFHQGLLEEITAYEAEIMIPLEWDSSHQVPAQALASLASQETLHQAGFENKCQVWFSKVNTEALRVLEENKRTYKEIHREFGEDIDAIKESLIKYAVPLTTSNRGGLFIAALHKNAVALGRQYDEVSGLIDLAPNQDELEILQARLNHLQLIKNNLRVVAKNIALTGADQSDQNLKKCIEIYNKSTTVHNKSKRFKVNHIDAISQISAINDYFYYGSLLSSTAVTTAQGLICSIPPALALAGKILPPLVYAVDALSIGLKLVYSGVTSAYLSVVEKKLGTKLVSSHYKNDFSLRTMGNTAALFLQVCAVLVFAGVLASNPVGWALIAAVSGIRWVTDMVLNARQTRAEYRLVSDKLAELNSKIYNLEELRDRAGNDADMENYNEELKGHYHVQHHLQQLVQKSHLRYQAKRDDAVWGLVGVVGSVLFACSIFFPPLGILGLGLIGISVAKVVLNVTLEYLSSKFAKKEEPILSAPIEEEVEPGLNTVRIEQALVNANEHSVSHSIRALPELDEDFEPGQVDMDTGFSTEARLDYELPSFFVKVNEDRVGELSEDEEDLAPAYRSVAALS